MILSFLISLLLRPTFNSCTVEVPDSLKHCKIEYRQSGGKWMSADPFRGSLLGLKEDTRYEVRFRSGKKVLSKETFRTWKTDAPVAEVIEIDPATFKAPYLINAKGSEDGWIRYVVKGGCLHNSSPVPTFEVKDAEYILIDDMVDTAGTITKAANLMMSWGAKSVRAIASHAVMSDPASQRVQDSQLTEMIFTDSIPYTKECDKVHILSIADLFADTIRRVNSNKSISSQYLL